MKSPNTMILQSFEHYDQLINFDYSSGTITEWVSKSSDPARVFEPTAGNFEFLGRRFVCLFRMGNELVLRIDDQQYSLHTYRMISSHSSDDVDGRIIRVLSDEGEVVRELRYNIENQDELRPWDTTPFVENEDFDFGLFIANVAGDRERQNRLYR